MRAGSIMRGNLIFLHLLAVIAKAVAAIYRPLRNSPQLGATSEAVATRPRKSPIVGDAGILMLGDKVACDNFAAVFTTMADERRRKCPDWRASSGGDARNA